MLMASRFNKSIFPQHTSSRKKFAVPSLRSKYCLVYGKPRKNHTCKERDEETGLYYYGARYLDPKTGRWLSGDPALGDYLPSAPVDEEARKRNGSLPGQGGVYNYVNLHVYHYAGNNPVKYVDPDGNDNVSVVAAWRMNANEFSDDIINGDKNNTKIKNGGCAVTVSADISTFFGFARNLGEMNISPYVKNGDVNWNALAGGATVGVTAQDGKFTRAMWDKQENDHSTLYTTVVKVKYDSNNSPHWVGVQGMTTIDGKDYAIIAPTSINDENIPFGPGRTENGWKNGGAGVLVPVDNITRFVTYSKAMDE